jgi:hypothetical protein
VERPEDRSRARTSYSLVAVSHLIAANRRRNTGVTDATLAIPSSGTTLTELTT